MRWMALGVVCTAVVLGSLGTPAQEQPRTATVKYEFRGSHILLKVAVNGESKSFVLDTGATNTSLSGEVAKALELDEIRRNVVRDAGGDFVVSVVRINSLEIGGLVVRDLSCSAGGKTFEHQREKGGKDIAGILGADVLSLFKLTIDYRAKCVTFERYEDEPEEAFTIQGDLFTSPKHNMTVKRPDATWEFVTDTPMPEIAVILRKQETTAAVEILVQDAQGISLDQILPLMEPSVRAQVEGYRRLSSVREKRKGRDCYILEYAGKDGGTEKQFRYFLFVENDGMYGVKCFARRDEFASFAEAFDAIADSVRAAG
jgi:hypothetical protein